jgi:hypothetical protein
MDITSKTAITFFQSDYEIDAGEDCLKQLFSTQSKQGNIQSWRVFAKIYTQELWKSKGYRSYTTYCQEVWCYGKTHAFDLVHAGIAIEFINAMDSALLNLPMLRNIKFAAKLGKVPAALREKVWNDYRIHKIPIPYFNTNLSVNRYAKLDESLDKLYRFYQPEEILAQIVPNLRIKDLTMLMQMLSEKINESKHGVRSEQSVAID